MHWPSGSSGLAILDGYVLPFSPTGLFFPTGLFSPFSLTGLFSLFSRGEQEEQEEREERVERKDAIKAEHTDTSDKQDMILVIQHIITWFELSFKASKGVFDTIKVQRIAQKELEPTIAAFNHVPLVPSSPISIQIY